MVMTFGHPIALFPAIGAVLLGGGPITTGALTASIAAGAFASSLVSGPIGRYRWHGIGIQRSIQVFGMATAVFGLVLAAGALGWFAPERVDESHANTALIVLAMITLAVTGAADNVSAIYRSTMMQAAVPDTMRGRLQGVFMVVVAGGPRVGALYAGTLATLTALWVPSLVGGLVIVALVGVLVRLNPGFRRMTRSIRPRSRSSAATEAREDDGSGCRMRSIRFRVPAQGPAVIRPGSSPAGRG
ncbi:hypothetical protein [Microbacterium lacticum]|uniref:hypothetical protein n=1 Tax=Microbacterium lacticum TaxID=33885 RepID=UPI001F5047DB|nr:hypothetical protein [Microbacterium lacticum]